MDDARRSVMRAPGRGVVRRSVTIAALWSMVAIVVGAIIVVAAGVVAGAVVGVAWLASNGGSGLAQTEIIWRVAGVSTWIVAALAMAVSVWVAAYASTEWGSRPRAILAILGAALATTAFALLESTGLVLAGLGMGWAIAIPAERVGRVAIRAVVCLLVGLVLPDAGALSGGFLAVVLVASPWAAAVLCWAADALWVLVAGRFSAPVDR